MRITEQHVSPDGLLRFIVYRCDDGDVCLGFDGEGFSWHTHADILAGISGLSEEAAVKQYVDELLNGLLIIKVTRVGGQMRDACILDGPYFDDPYKPAEEQVEFRFWDGNRAH